MTKAIALYSGGLDSTLSILVMLQQHIEITAINFTTLFGCSPQDKSACSNPDESIASQFGFVLKYSPITDKFLEIVKRPKFGYGKNANPCIDCRILMLKEVKNLMSNQGTDFIITGEVLGQRPMSQHRKTLELIEKEVGLCGYILRPLSAKLLPETIPEQNGLVDRTMLYDFCGRTRKPQIGLAKKFGLIKIPQPAGGCLLTDPIYSRRLKELLQYSPDCSLADISLLRIGRHFRLSESTKLVVGRNYEENCKIEKFKSEKINGKGNVLLYPDENIPGPTAIILSGSEKVSDGEVRISAKILARYSDIKTPTMFVKIHTKAIQTEPADEELINNYRI